MKRKNSWNRKQHPASHLVSEHAQPNPRGMPASIKCYGGSQNWRLVADEETSRAVVRAKAVRSRVPQLQPTREGSWHRVGWGSAYLATEASVLAGQGIGILL